MSLITIFSFLIILLVLVTIHEFGHFIVAKWCNMRVDEFAFGFPPKLFSRKKGETTYSVNAIPFGGYVSIWGENGEPNDEAKTHPRAFGNRPWWAQLFVLGAGVTMNMLFAWIIFIIISYGNIQVNANDELYGARAKNKSLMVIDASPLSPAYKAGLTPGTSLIKVTSKGISANLTTATSLTDFITAHDNDPFTFTFRNEYGNLSSTTVVAVYGIVPDKKAIGVSVESVGNINTSFFEAVKIGSQRTWNMTEETFGGLKVLLSSLIHGKNIVKDLSGPVGIARIVGKTTEYGYKAVLTLIAVLSINLAIFNVLPLPALDGGRMVVTVIEAVLKRKIPHKYYSWVNILGFFALILLLIIVTIHDILG